MNWINRKTQEPPKDTDIIVWDEYYEEPALAYYSSYWAEWTIRDDSVRFHYWMPAPESPYKEGK